MWQRRHASLKTFHNFDSLLRQIAQLPKVHVGGTVPSRVCFVVAGVLPAVRCCDLIIINGMSCRPNISRTGFCALLTRSHLLKTDRYAGSTPGGVDLGQITYSWSLHSAFPSLVSLLLAVRELTDWCFKIFFTFSEEYLKLHLCIWQMLPKN